MKLLKIVLAVLVLLAVVFVLGGVLLPDRAGVVRSVAIDRPPAQVFAVANDLSRFNDWSPWYPMDPEASYRFEGPDTGPGATMHWQGKAEVGSGTLRIVDSQAPSRVATEVAFADFGEPADAVILIEPDGAGGSTVTWQFDVALSGPTARWFGLAMPGMVGTDFEAGLARLKTLLESLPAVDLSAMTVERLEVAAQDVIAIAGAAPVADLAAVSTALGELYGELIAFAALNNLEIAGSPMTFTQTADPDTWRFQAALPVRLSGPLTPMAPIELLRTHAGPALVFEHVGPYEGLAAARAQLEAWAASHGLRRAGPIQDIFVSDPGDTAPEALVTRLVYPLPVE
jgi:effector-binding domain-containing protein